MQAGKSNLPAIVKMKHFLQKLHLVPKGEHEPQYLEK